LGKASWDSGNTIDYSWKYTWCFVRNQLNILIFILFLFFLACMDSYMIMISTKVYLHNHSIIQQSNQGYQGRGRQNAFPELWVAEADHGAQGCGKPRCSSQKGISVPSAQKAVWIFDGLIQCLQHDFSWCSTSRIYWATRLSCFIKCGPAGSELAHGKETQDHTPTRSLPMQ
jgi:hypothetical protein